MNRIRAKVLGALIAAALLIGTIEVVPATAADGLPEAGSPNVTSEPTAPTATSNPPRGW